MMQRGGEMFQPMGGQFQAPFGGQRRFNQGGFGGMGPMQGGGQFRGGMRGGPRPGGNQGGRGGMNWNKRGGFQGQNQGPRNQGQRMQQGGNRGPNQGRMQQGGQMQGQNRPQGGQQQQRPQNQQAGGQQQQQNQQQSSSITVSSLKNKLSEFLQLDQDKQRQILGELLYPLVRQHTNDVNAPKITGMLIDLSVLEVQEILDFLEDPASLKERVEEAEELIKTQEAWAWCNADINLGRKFYRGSWKIKLRQRDKEKVTRFIPHEETKNSKNWNKNLLVSIQWQNCTEKWVLKNNKYI